LRCAPPPLCRRHRAASASPDAEYYILYRVCIECTHITHWVLVWV
jgi:hypothetical protein